jgi:hypothetical protein
MFFVDQLSFFFMLEGSFDSLPGRVMAPPHAIDLFVARAFRFTTPGLCAIVGVAARLDLDVNTTALC